MKSTILEKNIFYYENIVDDPRRVVEAIEQTEKEDCDNLISKWQPWNSYDGKPYNYGTQKTVYPLGIKKFKNENTKNAEYIFEKISNAFYRASKHYSINLLEGKDPNLFLRFDIKKYKTGANMGTHADQVEVVKDPKYSLVMYLNDDYDGGEISFTIKDNLSKLKSTSLDYEIDKLDSEVAIKPSAGSIVMFPSFPPYHHTAHTVKSGYKYMITVFCVF